MSKVLTFYYDVASPYSYISAARINDVARRSSVTVRWTPFLLGGVFRSVGNTMPGALPARAKYMLKDLSRWSKSWNIPFTFSDSFPHNSLLAMRALTAAPMDCIEQLSLSIFQAAWVHNQDISKPDVVKGALGDLADELLTATQDPAVKERLKQTTQEAVDAGAFGAPSFVVGDELYWGNDRLEMAVVAAADQS
ncbi:MAG: 2-hydroxychromene-2-carboxylate isomerase [Myxococcota bacterium]|nr:2-hydroxychromene-2-carboxylate isomerase [Myxococcota bacterium]